MPKTVPSAATSWNSWLMSPTIKPSRFSADFASSSVSPRRSGTDVGFGTTAYTATAATREDEHDRRDDTEPPALAAMQARLEWEDLDVAAIGNGRRVLGDGRRVRQVVGRQEERRLAEIAERAREVAGGREAIVRVGGCGLRDRRIDLFGHTGDQRRVREPRGGDGMRCVAVERRTAGQHLVGHRAERVHVRARADVRHRDLLRSDVRDRSDRTIGRQVLRLGAERLRDPEVDDLDLTVRREEDVLRLHVPVDDPLGVCVVERSRDAARDVARHRGVEASEALEQRAEGRPLDELHDHEQVGREVADGGLAVVVDRCDVRVGQPSHVLPLAAEPLDEGGVGGEGRVHDLHGHAAAEDLVGRAVDGRHPARRDPLGDRVAVRQPDADAGVLPDVEVAHDRAHATAGRCCWGDCCVLGVLGRLGATRRAASGSVSVSSDDEGSVRLLALTDHRCVHRRRRGDARRRRRRAGRPALDGAARVRRGPDGGREGRRRRHARGVQRPDGRPRVRRRRLVDARLARGSGGVPGQPSTSRTGPISASTARSPAVSRWRSRRSRRSRGATDTPTASSRTAARRSSACASGTSRTARRSTSS